MNAGWLAAIAALVLGALCVRHHSRSIPIDLHTRSQQALREAGIAFAGLSFDGREALLRGVEGSPEVSARAQDIVREIWGVRTVSVETTPAPAPPPAPKVEEVQKKLTEMIRLKNVEFETASARITPAGRVILDEVAAVLIGAPQVKVAIEGHTDSLGAADSNLTLSRARAASVLQYLISKGIAAGRMTSDGFGATRPIASNNTADGRRTNRRIEFVVKQQ
jgi:outer membrane protein OmpA-like peptidoglycan-associated protein